MAHHSSDGPLGPNQRPEQLQKIRDLMREKVVAAAGETMVGSPVHSLGMTREQACEFGRMLITKAGRTCTIGFGE